MVYARKRVSRFKFSLPTLDPDSDPVASLWVGCPKWERPVAFAAAGYDALAN